jgi:hypothetical protein
MQTLFLSGQQPYFVLYALLTCTPYNRAPIHNGTAYEDNIPTKADDWHITISFAKEGDTFFSTAHGYTTTNEPDWRLFKISKDGIMRNWNAMSNNKLIWPEIDAKTVVEIHVGKPYADEVAIDK